MVAERSWAVGYDLPASPLNGFDTRKIKQIRMDQFNFENVVKQMGVINKMLYGVNPYAEVAVQEEPADEELLTDNDVERFEEKSDEETND